MDDARIRRSWYFCIRRLVRCRSTIRCIGRKWESEMVLQGKWGTPTKPWRKKNERVSCCLLEQIKIGTDELEKNVRRRRVEQWDACVGMQTARARLDGSLLEVRLVLETWGEESTTVTTKVQNRWIWTHGVKAAVEVELEGLARKVTQQIFSYCNWEASEMKLCEKENVRA